MKEIQHKGGYLVDPRLMGRIEFLVEFLREQEMGGAATFLLDRVADGLKEFPPVIVHSAQSLEKTNDAA